MLPGELSPSAAEGLVLLGAWMPFTPAAEYLARFWQVPVSTATARRHTEAGGAAYVAIQTAEVERLEREAPEPPPGPAVQQLSADGAMVPLVGGQWAEVRTVALGAVVAERGADGRPSGAVHATELSYFSRLADHETFIRLAHGELHRRGTETAGRVVGVNDGAEWEQQLLDRYRPDAVRVLDFPHGLEHLATAARATFGAGSAEASAWLAEQAHALKRDPPGAILAAVRTLPVAGAADPAAAAAARAGTLGYLEKRRDQLRYAEFLAAGYPIGSGLVESANKLVVEARLKGSGMHWAPENVNPMLALRTIVCSGRWDEAWPRICGQLRAAAQARRAARRQARRPAPPPPPAELPERVPTPAIPPEPRARLVVNGRPTADHPWRRPFLAGGRAKAASQGNFEPHPDAESPREYRLYPATLIPEKASG